MLVIILLPLLLFFHIQHDVDIRLYEVWRLFPFLGNDCFMVSGRAQIRLLELLEYLLRLHFGQVEIIVFIC